MTENDTAGDFASLIGASRVVVVAGSGGVGKTTTSAAIAVWAARQGRRVVVVTIDPAKRLADALGITGRIGNDAVNIDLPDTSGTLSALMLDTRTTFDALIDRYSPSPDQAERIRSNLFYRNISGALSGTQEYMAAEKLFELCSDERFDLVVVDTPPTRQALDFLSAPQRLRRFIDHPLYRIVIAPSTIGFRAVSAVSQPVLRTISRVVGANALDDALSFFKAFQGLDAGFRERAQEVDRVLHDASTKYVVVTSAEPEPIAEANYFIDQLEAQGVDPSFLIANRLTPDFGIDQPATSATVPEPLLSNLANLAADRDAEQRHLSPLMARRPGLACARLPVLTGLLDEPAETLQLLAQLGSLLGGGD